MVLEELIDKVVALEGCDHPAQSYLNAALRFQPATTQSLLVTWAADPNRRHAVLYCVSSLPACYHGSWVLPLVVAGLNDNRAVVRELAVELAATAGVGARQVLLQRAVGEPVGYLANYMVWVAADLQAVAL